MKAVLGCLLCLVLGTVESFALNGGPWSGEKRLVITGTYAGVLLVPGGPFPPDNSLAVFTLRVPREGLATGTSVVFRNGFVYPGTIVGSVDPDIGRVSAAMNGSFAQTLSTSTTGTGTIRSEYRAAGQFTQNAVIRPNKNAASSATSRITGRATLTYVNLRNDGAEPDPRGEGGPIAYDILGFKQSESGG